MFYKFRDTIYLIFVFSCNGPSTHAPNSTRQSQKTSRNSSPSRALVEATTLQTRLLEQMLDRLARVPAPVPIAEPFVPPVNVFELILASVSPLVRSDRGFLDSVRSAFASANLRVTPRDDLVSYMVEVLSHAAAANLTVRFRVTDYLISYVEVLSSNPDCVTTRLCVRLLLGGLAVDVRSAIYSNQRNQFKSREPPQGGQTPKPRPDSVF